MSLKKLLISSYGKKLQKKTISLQRIKIKAGDEKNKLIFLQKCLTYNIIPKSFRIRSPIKSKKAVNIMREFAKKMVVIAKNEAKYQFHCYKIKVRELSNIIKNEVSFEHYQIIQNATETSKEKQFVKKKNHLIKKFKKLHNEAVKEKTVEKRTSFLKSAVLNLTNDELPEHHKSLLNLGPKFVPSTKKIPDICPV